MIKREDCIKIGVVNKTHHLQGAVIIATDNNLIEKYSKEPLFLLLDGAPVPFFISNNGEGLKIRNHNSYIVKFDYVDNIAQSNSILGAELLILRTTITEEDLEEAEEFDIYDLIDYTVIDTTTDTQGIVTDAADYSGNIVLTIEIFNTEVLLPLSEEFIIDIDYDKETIYTIIPQGLLNLN